MPPCVGCTEPDGARLLAADSEIAEACNRLALQWSFAVELGDNPRMRQHLGRYGAAAFPDKHLKPGAAIFRRGKRDATGRQHRDIAAIGAVKDAKAPLLKPAEIEGMLDNLAETRCFDRV